MRKCKEEEEGKMKTLIIILAIMTFIVVGCDDSGFEDADAGQMDCTDEVPECYNTANTSGIMACEDGQWFIEEDCMEQGLCCVYVEYYGPTCLPCP